MEDTLILVDENDKEIGYLPKEKCHDGNGKLHRAFSMYVFNGNKLLIQKRSNKKRLWPGFWSNSCCSHPRKGEDIFDAVKRRLKEELGIECEPKLLFKFVYNASYEGEGSENEYLYVFSGDYN